MSHRILVSGGKRSPFGSLPSEAPVPPDCVEIHTVKLMPGSLLGRAACVFSLTIFFLGLSAILLGGCSRYANAIRNEVAVAEILSVVRKDMSNCYARVQFQADDEEPESAVCLISCPEGTETSAVGTKVKICYSHHHPEKDVLVTHPVGRIPKQDRFHTLGRCAPVTYEEALKCRRVFFGVLYAFIATLLLLILLCFTTIVSQKCRACFEKRRIVIPDPSTEMTGDHF